MSVTNESRILTKCTKVLEDVHALSIIKEVEKWPTLYSRDSRERGNTQFKIKIWREVGKSLFDDWENLTEAEKDCKVRELMKRWRNLRDTFKRQLEVENKKRSGHDIKKRTYIYYKHMLFLLPHMTRDRRQLTGGGACAEQMNDYYNRHGRKKEKRKGLKKKHPLEQLMLEETPLTAPGFAIKKTDAEAIDEDKLFALSLVPTLKKMSDDEKLTAKMEILKVLQTVKSNSLKKHAGDTIYMEESLDNQEIKVEYFYSENANASSISETEKSDQDSD